MITQYQIDLASRSKGFYLITHEVLEAIKAKLPVCGLLNIFIHHTSCGLTINENCDPSVRSDFTKSLDHIIKENEPFYEHTAEGPDDMPAHIKSSLLGQSLTIPITDGQVALGLWQGIYLCEFRKSTHQRKVTVTVYS